MTVWKLFTVVAILLTTNYLQWSPPGKPQCLSPVTTPFKAWTLQFAAQQQSGMSMWCPSCHAQDTTTSIIRAGHACGIVVNIINNFLSAATCKRLLLAYPRNYEPSWVARAVLFSPSFFLLPCLYWWLFPLLLICPKCLGGGTIFSSCCCCICDCETPVPAGHSGKVRVLC